ncbi:hypothetical protein Sjap_004346 [Stephania japonica]|uniref:Uncharacterized protein n=1 Tax=Stephania japonica TaxID=461633 RepID=A0AAP0PGY2_9MAGN
MLIKVPASSKAPRQLLGKKFLFLLSTDLFHCNEFMVGPKANDWFHVRRLGEKRLSLPPGDMGWPYIGYMLSSFKAFKSFKSSDPDSFI